MRFEFIGNACGIFHGDKGTKVLCDPWVKDGVFDGSWCHYPKLKTTIKDILDVDAIYLSHLHQDHYDDRTFHFRKDMPIFILDHGENYLQKILTKEAYTNLILIKDNETIDFKEFEITLYAPFAKHNFHDAKIGNIIDSAMVIQNASKVVFNANDNTPTPEACKSLREKFGTIDLSMLNYNAAGPYPSCFNNLNESEKVSEHDKILQRNYDYIVKLLGELESSYFLPFAGAYVLGGKLSYKNQYLATTTWDACALYLKDKIYKGTNIVCLRENDIFDLRTGTSNRDYIPLDTAHMNEYIKNDLSQMKYPYEYDKEPDLNLLLEDMKLASLSMLRRMDKLDIVLDTTIYVTINKENICIYESKSTKVLSIKCSLDLRLLRRILNKDSHWNDAEIGCHIEFVREPNDYEPDLHTALQFFHL